MLSNCIPVSCIMPTRGRRDFALRAINMFLVQTYQYAELLILDDQDDPSLDDCVMPRRVRRECLSAKLPIGAKRNVAVASAMGDVILHWDDDDIYHMRRIEDQVHRLVDRNAMVTGYNSMEFECADGNRWLYEGVPEYAIGASLCYRREFWQANPFPSVQVGEDKAFADAALRAGSLVTVPANGMITATIHAGNTSPRGLKPPLWRKLAAA